MINHNMDSATPSSYDTTGSWSSWFSGTGASLQYKDRHLVPALVLSSNLSKSEAKATVAAAMAGDHAAQHKIQGAINETLTQSNLGCCEKRAVSYIPAEVKSEMREVLQVLGQGDLDGLDAARAEFRAAMNTRMEQYRASGGCCSGSSCASQNDPAKE